MGITIKELSEISGYSCSTISRVITNKGNVKEETRKAIEKLLAEHEYRTNIMELRKAEADVPKIMVIVGDLDNWYYMETVRVIKHQLLDTDYTPVIGYSDNDIAEEEKYVRIALNDGYAGIIFVNVRGGQELAQLLEDNGIPVVFLNRGIKFAPFDSVCNDNYQGGYIATEYLIGMGHKKIGHLMGSLYSNTALERRRGYEDAMRDRGLVVTANSIHNGDLKSESGYQYGETLIKKGLDYTAVFCGNDLMAVGLLEAMADYGVKVPEKLSIVCFDDTLLAKRAKLTAIGAEPLKMGRTAVENLLSRIKGDEADAKTVFYKPRITIRESVQRLK